MTWAPENHFGRHLPFALLTGFLGSGKTTLLNRILADPRLAETAVAINEFGEVPLDQHFATARSEDVVVLANGCLCCFLPGDLEQGLARIFTRSDEGEIPLFRRLVIETSGLADPEQVLQTILEGPILSRFLWLDRVVTTVDAVHGPRQLDEHVEARKQVRIADRLVVTKTDLASGDEIGALEAKLLELGSEATLAPEADVESLFSPTFFDEAAGQGSLVGEWLERETARRALRLEDPRHAHRSGIATTTLVADEPLPWRELDLWLGRFQREHGDRLLRLKGIVSVAGEGRPVVVHGVHAIAHVPVALEAWPDADRRTRIVLVFRDLEAMRLQERWSDFVAEHALR